MDFRESFQSHMQEFPEETRQELERLADRDAFLSLQGITRVLDIVRPVINEVNRVTETECYGQQFLFDERVYGAGLNE